VKNTIIDKVTRTIEIERYNFILFIICKFTFIIL